MQPVPGGNASGNAGNNGNAGGNSAGGANGSSSGNASGTAGDTGSASAGGAANGAVGLGSASATGGSNGARGNGRDAPSGLSGIADFLGALFGGPKKAADQGRHGPPTQKLEDSAATAPAPRGTQPERTPPQRGRETGRGDQDIAREAVTRGQAVPFDKVLATVRSTVPGSVLDVKVSRNQAGTMTYTVTVLAKDGWYRDVVVDARRNRVLEVR